MLHCSALCRSNLSPKLKSLSKNSPMMKIWGPILNNLFLVDEKNIFKGKKTFSCPKKTIIWYKQDLSISVIGRSLSYNLTNVDPHSKGMMDFVSSDHGIAKDLRKYVIFKFFPVVCPDGVFLGNSRCTLLGADLNRPVHVLLSRFYSKFIQIKFV